MKSHRVRHTLLHEYLRPLALAAVAFSIAASAQANGKYEHMDYGIGTPQRLAAAREALREDTFPELNDSANTENFIAIDMACEKYPKGPVRQACTDAGKVRHYDNYKTVSAAARSGAQRSIAEQAREARATAAAHATAAADENARQQRVVAQQAREIQGETSAREAADAAKESRKERVRAATATLSGWDEHNAYNRCMKERDHSEASNPPPRDIRDRRPREPAIPPPDIAEACAADAKRLVAEETERAAVARAAAEAASKERKLALDACKNSDAARLAEASRFLAVTRDLSKVVVAQARDELERDKEVERLTGVANLKLRHDAGEVIVSTPKQLAAQFDDYRSLGGKARSIDAVESMPDPCRDLL